MLQMDGKKVMNNQFFLSMLTGLLLVNVAFSQDVQLSADSIQPNENNSLIVDKYVNTCVSFNATTGLRGSWYTRLRVPIVLGSMSHVEIWGNYLGCNQSDVKLYISALNQPSSWTGITETCSYDGYVSGTVETCKYRCPCRTTCDWLQIIRRPLSPNSPAWKLCYVKSCPSGWTLKGLVNRCYILQTIARTSSQAVRDCHTLDPLARLAEVRTAEEKQALVEMQGSTAVVLGGEFVQGQFQWMSNGDLVDPAYWGPGQPNGDEYCVTANPGGLLQDGRCSFTRAYICERQP